MKKLSMRKELVPVSNVGLAVERIGKSMSGEKFAEIKLKAFDDVQVSAFSVGRLGSDEPTEFFDWLVAQGVPMLNKERVALKAELARQLKKELKSYADGEKAYASVVDSRGWSGMVFATKYAAHAPKSCQLMIAAKYAVANDNAELEMSMGSICDYYKSYGRNNALFKFVVSFGFLPPLLNVMKDCAQPLFLLVGPIHCGKSSLLHVAAAPWGGDPSGPLGYLTSLSATETAVEIASMGHRDMLFALDDTQGLPPDPRRRALALTDVFFRIHSGRTRGRYNERPVDYRNGTLTASNHSMPAIMAAGGIEYSDALRDRVFELPCYYAHGALKSVPIDETTDRFVRSMKSEAIAMRGAAGERFIERLVRANATAPRSLRKKLEAWREMAHRALGARVSPRAADAFACVFVAGCLANEYGILPWSPERLLTQVKDVFDDHVRFTQGELVRLDPVRVLKQYIRKKAARFAVVRAGTTKPMSLKAVKKTLGIKYHKPDGSIEYCFLREQMDKAFKDAIHGEFAISALKAEGMLKLDRDGRAPKRKFCAERQRFLCIDAKSVRARKAKK